MLLKIAFPNSTNNTNTFQDEYERRLLSLCNEGIGDENEILYLLSQPEVDPNVCDEVKLYCW